MKSPQEFDVIQITESGKSDNDGHPSGLNLGPGRRRMESMIVDGINDVVEDK